MPRGRMQRSLSPSDRDRRGSIRYALFECIRDKGYAATSLADVALAAGISASHLLYYYSSKDAVLEDLFAAATRNMRADIAKLPWNEPAEAFDALGDYFFGGRAFSQTEQATMLQFWGLSTHYVRLRQTKAEFDTDLRERLTALFRKAKRPAGLSARDAAEATYGLLAGLLSTSYFVDDLELARAREIFRK
ncbi:MAG: TetR/AcrR family transcriptional regulator, partial [Candidatus Binatia bacterium]